MSEGLRTVSFTIEEKLGSFHTTPSSYRGFDQGLKDEHFVCATCSQEIAENEHMFLDFADPERKWRHGRKEQCKRGQ